MARVAVIGAGIIGLACAHRLAREGHAVSVFDPDPEGDKCSWGNAGAIATTEVVPASVPGALLRVPGWLLDPLGPVSLRPAHLPSMAPWLLDWVRAGRPARVATIAAALAALLGRVYDDLTPLLDALGLADSLHRRGALTVYTSAAALARDADAWALRRRHGIVCEAIGGAAARALEPALASTIAAAVFTPDWSHVSDPKALWAALLASVRASGVTLVAARVADIARPGRVRLASGEEAACDAVVLAAGAWSAALARGAGDRVLLESERGYNMTLPQPNVALDREIIFAERHFVATPLSVGLRIGGAAEFSGLAAPPRHARARVLAELARAYLPDLARDGGTAWMGQRPTTPDSLPVLGPSPRRADVIYAFGHGHLGLTLAATSARLVADCVAGRPAAVDLRPYAAGRFG